MRRWELNNVRSKNEEYSERKELAEMTIQRSNFWVNWKTANLVSIKRRGTKWIKESPSNIANAVLKPKPNFFHMEI